MQPFIVFVLREKTLRSERKYKDVQAISEKRWNEKGETVDEGDKFLE